MAKTNFTKVEEILSEGIRKIEVNHLLDLADAAATGDSATEKKQGPSDTILRVRLLHGMLRDMTRIRKLGKESYKECGITIKTLKKHLDNPDKITEADWKKVKEAETKIEKLKKEFEISKKPADNQDLVEQQRHQHKTKRFNINEKWLPLQ